MASAAGVVVRARFLHVRGQDNALVRADATRNLRNQRAVRATMKGAVDLDVHIHRALRELVSQPLGGARRGLESERAQRVVGGNAPPLQDIGSLARPRIWRDLR